MRPSRSRQRMELSALLRPSRIFQNRAYPAPQRGDEQEKYRSLFRSSHHAFCVIKLKFDAAGKPVDYQFKEINAAFARHTGIDDAVGRWMRDIAPGHEQYWFDIYGKVATTGKPIEFEHEAQALGRWFEVYAYRIGAARSRKVGILFGDVTERKKREKTLWDMDRRKNEFITTLAHELRQPLAPLGNAIQLMKSANLDPQRLPSLAAMMERQFLHLSRLMEDILDVARISTGKVEIRKTPMDLNQTIIEVMEMAAPRIQAAKYRTQIKLPEQPLMLIADKARVVQIVLNLLNNALKYSPSGTAIEIAVSGEARNAVVSIKDEGIGMQSDLLPRVFDLYSQAALPGMPEDGLSIGLSVAKLLVELHGGSIQARSDGIGKGSEFSFSLPLGG